MKKLTALTVAGLLTIGFTVSAIAHGGGWGRSRSRDFRERYSDDYRPGNHMGYGMGYGYGHGPGYCWTNPADLDRVTSADEAKDEVEAFLGIRKNPNLKAGKVVEKDDVFEVEILTKEDSLADKLIVEKGSGRIFPAYR